jgi:hypothetical protein
MPIVPLMELFMFACVVVVALLSNDVAQSSQSGRTAVEPSYVLGVLEATLACTDN